MAETQTPKPRENEATIKIRAFPYYVDMEDPVSGRLVRQERVAIRGETIKLTDVDYARAQKFDAIETDDDAGDGSGPDPVAAGSLDINTATVPDLSAWIKSEKPTVDEVVEEANNDPIRAQKLLDAEKHATGDQPRATLVSRLEEIIG